MRQAWQQDKKLYDSYFEAAGGLAESARGIIENGMVEMLGPLMDANHGLLRKMGVSSPELDRLAAAALQGSAWGAKLSGGGRGGNMIALASAARAEQVAAALTRAGAVRTIITTIGKAV